MDPGHLRRSHGTGPPRRLLSNTGVNAWDWFTHWVMFVVAARQELVVALDWTEFDKDDHATIAMYLVTSHGRATPLLWKTVQKSRLKNRRNDYEAELIERLHTRSCLKRGIVTLLADRGFGDQKLFMYLEVLEWSYAIRFRQIIHVTHRDRTMSAGEWMPVGGHAKMLRDVQITADKTSIPAVVLKHQKGMKEAWCIATNRVDLGAAGVVKLHARRFTIEETFRDIKDNHFGMGLSATHIGSAQRRDRLLLLAAVAHALLTLLGAAGEACGFDRTLKANTVKTSNDVALQPRLLLVRCDPGDARREARAPHDGIRASAVRTLRFPRNLRAHLRGWVSNKAADAGVGPFSDCLSTGGPSICFYASWKVSASKGEKVHFIGPDNTIINEVEYPMDAVPDGQTWGRLPDLTGDPAANKPTPGDANAAP